MDHYSPAELSELLLLAQGLIDTQFQYWITITFAMVVAGFAAGERLTQKLRYAVVTLYLLATLVLGGRSFVIASNADSLAEVLEQSNSQIFDLGWGIGFARTLVYVLGTSVAIYFLLASGKVDDLE